MDDCLCAGWPTLGGHVMVAVEDFRSRHAYILAEAVDHLRPHLPVPAAAWADEPSPLAVHAGAAAYRSGEPLPVDEQAR